MNAPGILCYIVAYNAAPFIEKVLDAIPAECWDNPRYRFAALISDDCSLDDTVAVCERYIAGSSRAIEVTRTPRNLGYGGNQKLGYDYAIANGYDAVVLLHGDGQYDPACIPALIAPVLAGEAGAVLGSRMMRPRDALSGGMPMYKFIGNIMLTGFQNRVAGSKLSEFHTGLRAYSTKALKAIAYGNNSDGFVFDTQILLQLMHAGSRIAEIPIPTHYGDEPCRVNALAYAWQAAWATVAYRLHVSGLRRSLRYAK